LQKTKHRETKAPQKPVAESSAPDEWHQSCYISQKFDDRSSMNKGESDYDYVRQTWSSVTINTILYCDVQYQLI